MMAPSAKPQPSSKSNPCGVCGRTKDGDCRLLENGTWLCHGNTSHKRGTTIVGNDGQDYGFAGVTDDGRCGIFPLDKPLVPQQRRHLRVVASGGTAISAEPLLAPPAPESFFLARFTPKVAAAASKKEGDFYYYDDHHRQQRQGRGNGKAIYSHHLTASGWAVGAGDGCPAWNEGCLSAISDDSTAIYVEGEPAAVAACKAGLVALSMPGQEAESLGKCSEALRRHKAMGLQMVAYVADNDQPGKKKAAVMANAAAAAGLPFVGINAGEVWPDLPKGGSFDDLEPLGDEVVALVDQAFRDELQRISASTNATTDAIGKETAEKKATLARLVDDLVEARCKGDTVKAAALMSQTWRLGIPSATTDELILQRWAELRGISIEEASAPVQGRTIGQQQATTGLQQRVPGFLLENGLHLLIADAGVGKTTISLELALLLSNGGPKGFLDQQAPITKKGKVLFIGTDGGSTAFDMLSDYAADIADPDQWGGVEFWCEEAGKKKPWTLTLPNLELLVARLAKGDITAVFIDTINSVFQGAGLSPYLGPVDQYLRLLKAIVCPYGPLVMLGHTNRSGAGIKGIGGSPAFQEVPDGLHIIERLKQPQEDGTLVFRWTMLKLRGESFRQFSYARVDGELRVVEGHFHTNCGDKLLVAIKKRREQPGMSTAPKWLVADTKEAPASVRSALLRLRQKGLVEKRGTGYQLTAQGEAHMETLSY